MNSEQIETVLKEYGEDIYRFCCYLTRNREYANDLYQEVFLKALEIQRHVDENNMKSFFVGIAANVWKNQCRKDNRRQKIISPAEFCGDYMSEQSDRKEPLNMYITKETNSLIYQLVSTLPEKYQIVVLMYYSVDMSTQEIATTLHISKGTVTSRLKRARERIKKSLEENGYER